MEKPRRRPSALDDDARCAVGVVAPKAERKGKSREEAEGKGGRQGTNTLLGDLPSLERKTVITYYLGAPFGHFNTFRPLEAAFTFLHFPCAFPMHPHFSL